MQGRRASFVSAGSPVAPARGSLGGASFTDGIDEANLSINSEGALRLQLDSCWQPMLADLAAVGQLLVITRNEAAVIARFMEYPNLRAIEGGETAEDEEGDFHFDFHWWHRAWARHSPMPRGQGYSVDFLDREQQAFHSVVLTGQSGLGAFSQWLQRHQALSPLAAARRPRWEPGVPLADGSPAPSPTQEQEESTPLDEARFLAFLEQLKTLEVPMRAAVGHEGAMQQHCFRPRKVRQSGRWLFCSDDETGLHIDLDGIASLTLHHFSLQGQPCRSIKAWHANGRLLFFLAPTGPAYLNLWSQLLEA